MAHIPMGDIRELWSETSDHSWSGLIKTLNGHRGKAEGISDSLVDLMLMVSNTEEKKNRPYPNSSDELYNVLNEGVAKIDHL